IRGYPLSALAGHFSYEDVISLLLDGFVEDLPGSDGLVQALGKARCDVFERVAARLPDLASLALFDGVRAGLSLMPGGSGAEDALRLIAAPAVLTAALIRVAAGKPALAPDPNARHAADVLRMLGTPRSAERLATGLDTYLVTVSDHGLNASTFAARVVA